MATFAGLRTVVEADLLAATYAKAEAEGKTLAEVVTELLQAYTAPPASKRRPRRAKASAGKGAPSS